MEAGINGWTLKINECSFGLVNTGEFTLVFGFTLVEICVKINYLEKCYL